MAAFPTTHECMLSGTVIIHGEQIMVPAVLKWMWSHPYIGLDKSNCKTTIMKPAARSEKELCDMGVKGIIIKLYGFHSFSFLRQGWSVSWKNKKREKQIRVSEVWRGAQ